MIEAGTKSLFAYDEMFWSAAERVAAVYRSMAALKDRLGHATRKVAAG